MRSRVTRADLLATLADRIARVERPHPVRVALDGIDAAGKTTLADELVGPLAARGRAVIRASVDGFQRPRAERYRRGADSPEGYYLDAFDYPALRAHLLLPLGPGGDGRYRRRVFDLSADAPISEPPCQAPPTAVLLCDGVFLLRPELADCWDYRIVVDVDPAVALARAIQRDRPLFGSDEAVVARYARRYTPGQRLYLEAVRPRRLADAVVQNDDPARPLIETREPASD